MQRPNTRTPAPGVTIFTNLCRPFLGHHYYILGLSDLCLRVEKILKEKCIIWPRPSTRTPAPGVMKFTNWVEPSLVIITTYLVCLIYALDVRRRFLKKYINFTLLIPKLPPFCSGVIKFTISCIYTLRMLHTNMLRLFLRRC